MPLATELPKKTKVPRSKMFEEEDIMTPESEAGYSPLLDLMGKYDKSEENDERTKALKDLMQRYVISKSPAQARAETDVMNQEALLGAMSRAQSKLGTLGGKEAGSTLPQKDFGTVQPQLNTDLLKLLIDKPYGGIDPRLVQAARTEIGGGGSGRSTRGTKSTAGTTEDDGTYSPKEAQKFIPKLQKDMSVLRNSFNDFENLEGILGHNLDDLRFDIGKNKIYDMNGKEVEPPGRNIWGLGRMSLGDPRGREINTIITDMLSKKIKLFAGAAVNTSELERIQKGFAMGRFNTETEMFSNLQKFKQAFKQAIQDLKAAYPKEAVNLYEERGGWTGPQERIRPTPIQTSPSEIPPPKQDEGIREITGPLKFRRKSTGRTYSVKPGDPRVERMLKDPDLEMIGGSNAK